MATATFIESDLSATPHISTTVTATEDSQPAASNGLLSQHVLEWADLIRNGLQAMYNGDSLNAKCLEAPRRKHADQDSATLAVRVAELLYPAPTDSTLPQVIKYEKDIVLLRKAIQAQRKAEELARLEARTKPTWKQRILAQGPWDEVKDPVTLDGVSSLPMPVTISDEESLSSFFNHLGVGGTHDTLDASKGQEPFYGTDLAEFEKGVLYEDGRMDLCKMVLGPPNISKLMASLSNNTFVRHFLLGNNMIGPVGARNIADWVSKHPDQIETWYLAGNCIDLAGLERLVPAWISSNLITNIWLKRNPLGPDSYPALFRLITETPHLRTLDLDQTELSDNGVAQLFSLLNSYKGSILPLRHIYSTVLANNPLGDAGAIALAGGLRANTSLLRLIIASCGIKTDGARHILEAVKGHSGIMTLNMAQNYATDDLGMRYNFLEDGVVDALKAVIAKGPKSLRMLDLGTTGMTLPVLWTVAEEVAKSKTLVAFIAKSVYGKLYPEAKLLVNGRIEENLKQLYGMDVAQFEAEEKRWLISPKDVRLIDSVYRNRDAGLAMRGMMTLKKVWEDGTETVNKVMRADDVQLAA